MPPILCVVLALSMLVLLRNNMTFRYRMRRLAEIKIRCDEMIEQQNFLDEMEQLYADFYKVNYHEQVFDLSKWTYKQFYPNPVTGAS